MRIPLIATLTLVAAAAGCASTPADVPSDSATAPDYRFVDNPLFASIARARSDTERDRRAILAMQGDYAVDFRFDETVVLKSGYERRDDKNSGGYETVIVVEDSATKIVLQHLLVTPHGQVIKHWRQDWHYEAPERFEFVADQTWEVQPVDARRTSGAWTQCVYEVSDAPRYCGTGHWNHRYGVSTWTSDRSWRPLPRREYTKRQDYNALNAENRHTVTPRGWTHEQDNTKTVRDGRSTRDVLVREFGFNDYRSIDGFDFSPAREYWQRTGEYWGRVRDAWARRLASGSTLVLTTDVDGMPLIAGTLRQASELAASPAGEQLDAIETLLAAWTDVRPSVEPVAATQGRGD